jgi:hypothetical protein
MSPISPFLALILESVEQTAEIVLSKSAKTQTSRSVQEQEETKRLCNPLGNDWNPSAGKATMKIAQPDGLAVHVHNSSPVDWGNIIAQKGFPVSASRQFRQNYFARPILYYYEITAKSPLLLNEG